VNGPQFAAVRYGNVMGSNGSVIPKWRKAIAAGEKVKLTDPTMTRFWILVDQAANFIIDSSKKMTRGEVFIPKMKSCTMLDLAKAMGANDYEVIGKRPGEKLHEKLFGADELDMVTQTENAFIRWPLAPKFPLSIYGKKVEEEHTSFNAQRFTQEELKELLCSI
jgi:UDP-N-acetylglucosamine 4,6-dehydratase